MDINELALMRDRYRADGFIQIESLTTADDIAVVRSLIDPLFSGGEAVTVVDDALRLAPALRQTRAYVRCRTIARHLLGVPVGPIFDQAVRKAPQGEVPSYWHQDEIYNTAPIPQRAVNFWIPLEAANIENGCLWQLPGSHRGGLRPHHEVALAAGSRPASPPQVRLALDEVDDSRAVPCQAAPGAGTAHSPLSAHYAGPNTTARWRGAWVVHFGAYGRLRYKLHPRAIAAKLRLLK